MIKYLIGVVFLGLLACNGNQDQINTVDLSSEVIHGSWKLTEQYVSPGGATQWQPVADGNEFVFHTNGSFSFSQENCSSGTYFLEDNILKLECDNTDNGELNYRVSVLTETLMEISYVGCIEACVYRYKKQ